MSTPRDTAILRRSCATSPVACRLAALCLALGVLFPVGLSPALARDTESPAFGLPDLELAPGGYLLDVRGAIDEESIVLAPGEAFSYSLKDVEP